MYFRKAANFFEKIVMIKIFVLIFLVPRMPTYAKKEEAILQGHQNVSVAEMAEIRWVEERDGKGYELNMDRYFDRVVMLCNKDTKKVISSGVLVDNVRVLTSFNPYRQMVKDGTTGNIVVAILMSRQDNSTSYLYNNSIHYFDVECQEKLIDIPDDSLSSEQWHGFNKEHCPVHDLYLLKIKGNLTMLNPKPYKNTFYYVSHKYPTRAGPMITILAKKKDELEIGVPLKFASLGYMKKSHITNPDETRLRSYEFPSDTNAEVDCDEWMIRDWGRFICLKNDEKFLGIASGALLIQNEKLFGIGSFTLKKGNASIFVFTDIRTFRKEIFNTCGDPPLNTTDEYKHQIDPSEDIEVPTTTPRALSHLSRRFLDDWH